MTMVVQPIHSVNNRYSSYIGPIGTSAASALEGSDL